MVSAYFLDSSALVKRYVPEMGSGWMQSITAPATGNSIAIAMITWVEVHSAFARRQREGSLSNDEIDQLVQDFCSDFENQYEVIKVDKAVVEKAGELILKYPLRAYDAVQLASALRLQLLFSQMPEIQLIFVSADDRLLNFAQSEGWGIENPNRYL